MFATRGNNENAIYEQQTAAAAKPLNQGVKGLAPKTPANKAPKTPFRGARNDENARSLAVEKADGKGAKSERDAFVTPANPRTRAPLGNKTTNAKAFLQTPAPLGQQGNLSAKPTSPRLRRSKIQVHEATAEAAEDVLQSDDEREIEYMPPRSEPVPEYPDDVWPHDREYPELQGANFTRGWLSEYTRKDTDEELDFTGQCRKAEEEKRWHEERNKRVLASKSANTSVAKTAPTTLKAQNAASALASKPAKPRVPHFAVQTAAAEARRPVAATTAAKKPASTAAPGNPRFTAAKVASNNTIGYSKGRQVSASARAPLSSLHPGRPLKPAQSEKVMSLSELLGFGKLSVNNDGDAPPLFPMLPMGDDDEEYEEEEVFQLPTEEL